MIRIQNDTAVISTFSHSTNKGTTTGLMLQTDEAEYEALKGHLMHYTPVYNHRLLLRTSMTELSLLTCMDDIWDAKTAAIDIEHNTGQHIWDTYTPRDEKPKTDAEVSRLSHGLRIYLAVCNRRIDVVDLWIDLLIEKLTPQEIATPDGAKMLQWLKNLKTQTRMAKVDVDFVTKRADNQVGAVSTKSTAVHIPDHSDSAHGIWSESGRL